MDINRDDDIHKKKQFRKLKDLSKLHVNFDPLKNENAEGSISTYFNSCSKNKTLINVQRNKLLSEAFQEIQSPEFAQTFTFKSPVIPKVMKSGMTKDEKMIAEFLAKNHIVHAIEATESKEQTINDNPTIEFPNEELKSNPKPDLSKEGNFKIKKPTRQKASKNWEVPKHKSSNGQLPENKTKNEG